MASLIPSGSASGTGSMTLSAPVTNSNQTATLPDATGTVMVSGNMPAFSVYKSASQTITTATWTKVTLDTELFDTNNNFASSRFTPTVAGYYQINAAVACSNTSAYDVAVATGIYKNGTLVNRATVNFGGTGYSLNNATVPCSAVIYLNGSTDYIELYGYISASGTPEITGVNLYDTCLSGVLVRAA